MMSKIFAVLLSVVMIPACSLVINALNSSYNQNTDQCYYTVDLTCKTWQYGNCHCTQFYVVHLWREDVNGQWDIVFAECHDAALASGDSLHINSGLAPLYGPGPYWFQVDVWNGQCGGGGVLMDSTWVEFARP